MMKLLLIVVCGQLVAGYGINVNNYSGIGGEIRRYKRQDNDDCDPNPCNNNGECVDQDNGYSCTCVNGYVGRNCEIGKCGAGWVEYERSCYFFSDDEKNWTDAKEACRQRESELVEINDASENEFLTSKQVEFGNASTFIGATDSNVEGIFVWSITGQTMNYSSWAPGEPNNAEEEDCAALAAGGWNDDGCDKQFKYICERTAFLSVESCTTSGVEYTVYSGHANGVTYIGGTTSDSSECVKTLAGTASESILLNFGTCGVYPTLDPSTNSIEVRVIVQRNAVVRSGDDLIYAITCTYGELEDVVVTAELWAKSSDVTSEIAVEIFPLPIMTLYRIEDPSSTNYIQMSNDTVVILGTPLRQKIALDKNLPNYRLLVQTCSMEARRMPEDVFLREILLLDNETSCSRLGVDIYPEFTYLTDDVTVNGNQFDVPYALNEFEAFIPMIPIIDLVGSSVKLVISCRCSVCFGNNTACDPPTCGSNRRRRVAVGENPDVKNYDSLIASFQIQIEDGKKGLIKEPNEHSTEAEVVGSLNFWAILVSAVAAVVVTVSVTGVILHMKKVKGHSGLHDDRRPTKRNRNNSSNGGWSDIYLPGYMPRTGPPMHTRQFQHRCYDLSA